FNYVGFKHSTVSYTSISSNSNPSAWGIPLMDASELEHHVSVYFLEPAEDPEEDPIDYAADADDDEDGDEESSEDDDDEEEEHLAPADSTVVASLTV
ncbi:hypothetical protein Tco_0305835, partial [Tanacetum coccineum]